MKSLVFSGALIMLIMPLATAAVNDPVRIDSGLISGTFGQSPEVRVFKGIPYAAPPLGNLRWRPPQPAARWEGVRKTEAFGPACIQDTTPGTGVGLLRKSPRDTISEDCLLLNIWTAARSANDRRPVMVYFHGGACVYGSADEGLYDGEALAKKGVVYVNLNYRLGALGFLAHPELTKESEHHVSGNYGFLDEIAALQWVQRNIAAFGGDPKRVTIFGQSSGSMSINALMASPLAKGLFRGGISESFDFFGKDLQTPTKAEQAGLKFAKDAGASSLAELRAKPAADLMKAQLKWWRGGCHSNLNVDGWFMLADIYTIFATGKQYDVPLIAGSNSDESRGYPAPVTAAAFIEQVRRRYGNKADAFLKLYPAGSDEEAMKSQTLSTTDQDGSYESRTFAQLQARTGKAKSYLYRFSHRPPVAGPDGAIYNGVFHGAELYYVFQQYGFRGDWAWTDADRKLGDTMSSYWVNFATTGNPNGKGLPKWPAYDDKVQDLMNFGDQVSVMPVPRKAALDFFESVFHPAGGSTPRPTGEGVQ